MTENTPTSVYKYLDDFGVLIYVGITSRGIRRQREHNKDKSWWEFVATQQVEHYSTRQEALDREEFLILEHQPPFNTQHNEAYRARQASYMHFRDLPELDKSPLEIAQELDKQIPLAIVSRDGSDTTFATPMKFAPLAVGLHVPKSAKAIFETTRCGNVVAARMRGPIMEISMQVRKTIEFTNAFARVKVTMSKTGAEFELKNIQLL